MKRMIATLLIAVLVLMTVGSALAAVKIKTTAKMYLRKGPGEDYDTVGTVRSGTKLYVRKANSSDGTLWFKIISGKYKGRYISSQFTKSAVSKFTIKVRTTGTVNFRDAGTTAGSVIRTISKGKKLTCNGYKNGWFRVKYKGVTGYVYGYRLKAA